MSGAGKLARLQRQGRARARSDVPRLSIEQCDLAVRQRTLLIGVISREYFSLMQREYDSIRPHLPRPLGRVLDIGGGLGGVHVHAARDLGFDTEVHFLDRNKLDREMLYGYRDQTESYNSFDESRRYLRSAGFRAEKLHYWDADTPADLERLAKPEQKFDAVISLKSWCFHYPAAVYAALASQVLDPGGTLIVDARHDSEWQKYLLPDFDLLTVIAEDAKSERLCLRRKPVVGSTS